MSVAIYICERLIVTTLNYFTKYVIGKVNVFLHFFIIDKALHLLWWLIVSIFLPSRTENTLFLLILTLVLSHIIDLMHVFAQIAYNYWSLVAYSCVLVIKYKRSIFLWLPHTCGRKHMQSLSPTPPLHITLLQELYLHLYNVLHIRLSTLCIGLT